MNRLIRAGVTRDAGTRAFSLIEAVGAILVVSLMLVAALTAAGAAKATEATVAERSNGLLLAQALMAEIFQRAYEDPDQPPGSFGLESDESGDGSRALWDDVDDYNGWTASPPENKDGTAVPWADGYARFVRVNWVEPDDLATTSATATGVKRIRVTVEHDGREILTLWACRTAARPDPGAPPGGSN